MKHLLPIFALVLSVCTSTIYAAEAPWLLIDGTKATLDVMRDGRSVAHFDNIAFGRRGTQPIHFKDDDSTPIGEFRIDNISMKTMYGPFFGINYPTEKHARIALDNGKISREAYLAIFNAESQGRPPPYTTPLGGMIGIHGIGAGNLEIHRKFNWTRGCVALDNQQIDALSRWVKIGMKVVIK